MQETDVLIVGAGPSGSACALLLADAGIPVTILDKAEFPRDKICGDALSPEDSLITIDPRQSNKRGTGSTKRKRSDIPFSHSRGRHGDHGRREDGRRDHDRGHRNYDRRDRRRR